MKRGEIIRRELELECDTQDFPVVRGGASSHEFGMIVLRDSIGDDVEVQFKNADEARAVAEGARLVADWMDEARVANKLLVSP